MKDCGDSRVTSDLDSDGDGVACESDKVTAPIIDNNTGNNNTGGGSNWSTDTSTNTGAIANPNSDTPTKGYVDSGRLEADANFPLVAFGSLLLLAGAFVSRRFAFKK